MEPQKRLGKSADSISYTIYVSRESLTQEFEDYAKSLVAKAKPSLEEVFQQTLDLTTPATPGDVRTTREWRTPYDAEPESQWL